MPSGRGTILFVDDNDTLRRVLSTVLEDEGYQVLQFHTPTDARATLDQGTTADLVICDVIIRGRGTSRGFIADLGTRYPALPVLVISGLGPEQTRDLLGGAVPRVFVQKPFTVEELLEHVTALVGSATSCTSQCVPHRAVK